MEENCLMHVAGLLQEVVEFYPLSSWKRQDWPAVESRPPGAGEEPGLCVQAREQALLLPSAGPAGLGPRESRQEAGTVGPGATQARTWRLTATSWPSKNSMKGVQGQAEHGTSMRGPEDPLGETGRLTCGWGTGCAGGWSGASLLDPGGKGTLERGLRGSKFGFGHCTVAQLVPGWYIPISQAPWGHS